MLVTWYHKNNENDSLTSFLHNNFKYHTLTEQINSKGAHYGVCHWLTGVIFNLIRYGLLIQKKYI